MTLLEIINEASSRLDEPSISDAFSTNSQAKKYLSSAKKMAKDIAKRYNWEQITIPTSFKTYVNIQEYKTPDDYKEVLTDFLYNTSNQLKIQRETPDMEQNAVLIQNTSWSNTNYRIVRNKFRFTVKADSEDTITYEYKSKYLVENCDGFQETFTTSDDEFILDDEALIMGIVYDIARKYEFDDLTILKQEYEQEILDLKTKDGGKFVIYPTTEAGPLPTGWSFTGE